MFKEALHKAGCLERSPVGALVSQRQAFPNRRLPGRHRCVHVEAIHIDRRHHLELAWKRQQEREQQLSADISLLSQPEGTSEGKVIEVYDLAQLDRILEWAGNSLVVVCFYTRSCGACKSLLSYFEELSKEVRAPTARASSSQLTEQQRQAWRASCHISAKRGSGAIAHTAPA